MYQIPTCSYKRNPHGRNYFLNHYKMICCAFYGSFYDTIQGYKLIIFKGRSRGTEKLLKECEVIMVVPYIAKSYALLRIFVYLFSSFFSFVPLWFLLKINQGHNYVYITCEQSMAHQWWLLFAGQQLKSISLISQV